MNNPFVNRPQPGMPAQSPYQGMLQQPTSYSAFTRYYSPAANSGMTQSDINNASYDQLVRGVRTGGLLYNDPNAPQRQQGMFQPFMPIIPQMPSSIGGVSYPQFNMFNPYTQGMLSPYMMPQMQPQVDPYALPTSPQANPFGGYTDYTGVNQDFIDMRRNLIDAIANRTGLSTEQSLQALNQTGFLDSILTGMGGRRYGETTATPSKKDGGFK